MKFILIVVLFSTMLFSAQKQIILGCFLEDGNGAIATDKLNSYIASDSVLSENMRVNLYKVELKKVGDYDVVTIAPFNTSEQLSVTLKLLSKYYDDSYVLNYPLSSRVIKKQFTSPNELILYEKKVIPEPKEEPVVEPIAEIVEVLKEELVVKEKELTQEKEVVEAETDLISEVDEKPIEKEILEVKETIVVKDEITPTVEVKDDIVEQIYTPVAKEEAKEENHYLEYALALLGVVILLVIGIFVYIRRKKEEPFEFDFTE